MMMQKMGSYQMTIIDLPMNIVYGVCLFGFAAMAAALAVGGSACTGSAATACWNAARNHHGRSLMLKILFLP